MHQTWDGLVQTMKVMMKVTVTSVLELKGYNVYFHIWSDLKSQFELISATIENCKAAAIKIERPTNAKNIFSEVFIIFISYSLNRVK